MNDETRIEAANLGLDRLRGFRNRPAPKLDVGTSIAHHATELKRLKRKLGGAGKAWADVVPEELADRAMLVGVRNGVLTVKAADSPARFELDRFLRSGGEKALIRASSAPIRSVRVVE